MVNLPYVSSQCINSPEVCSQTLTQLQVYLVLGHDLDRLDLAPKSHHTATLSQQDLLAGRPLAARGESLKALSEQLRCGHSSRKSALSQLLFVGLTPLDQLADRISGLMQEGFLINFAQSQSGTTEEVEKWAEGSRLGELHCLEKVIIRRH